jgi:hypothetical protein
MSETLTPFHQQAEELGAFLLDDRARDAERRRDENEAEGPSENID